MIIDSRDGGSCNGEDYITPAESATVILCRLQRAGLVDVRINA